MKHTTMVLILLVPLGYGSGASAQAGQATKPAAAAQVLRGLIAQTESELTGVAEEMPADTYDFAPTQGLFRGVRTFAKQVKHAAAVQHLAAASLLGEPITSEMAEERGPDSVKTKAEILKYLKDSFDVLNRAAGTVDEKNAFAPFKGVFGSEAETRVGVMIVALTHSSNHYGQMVEYLRMNGHAPPR